MLHHPINKAATTTTAAAATAATTTASLFPLATSEASAYPINISPWQKRLETTHQHTFVPSGKVMLIKDYPEIYNLWRFWGLDLSCELFIIFVPSQLILHNVQLTYILWNGCVDLDHPASMDPCNLHCIKARSLYKNCTLNRIVVVIASMII